MKYIWLILAITFFIMGLWLVLQTVRCKHPIKARFIDVHILKSAGMKDYFPIFRYKFEGCEYNVRSVQSFSLRYMKQHFVVDREYEVYIDPAKPRNVAVYNKPRPADYLVILIGVVCLILFFAT